MELNTGLCGLCSSEKEVVNPGDSNSFWEMMYSIFGNGEVNLKELKNLLKVCTTCIFNATLIESKLEFFKSGDHNESISLDHCKFCKEKSTMLRMKITNFHKKFIFGTAKGRSSRMPGCISICASCYYAVEASFIMKKNVYEMSRSKKNSFNAGRIASSDDSNLFEQNENREVETPPLRNSSKRKRREIVDNIEDSDKNKLNSYPISKPKNIKENSIIPVENSVATNGEQHSKKPSLKVTLTRDYEEHNTRRAKGNKSFQVTSMSESLRDSIKKSNTYKKPTVENHEFDLSKVLQLSPLSKKNLLLDGIIMQDQKFFRCIPFVKMTMYKNSTRKINRLKVKREPSSPPPTLRKPLPIKIKLKNPKVRTDLKKTLRHESVKQNLKKIPTKEVIIKVARLKLPLDKSESCSENNFSDQSLIENETPLDTEGVTPKKKKRVHFNDTPTIIITGDEMSEDFDSLEEDVPRRRNLKRKKMAENIDLEVGEKESKVENVDTSKVEGDDEDKLEDESCEETPIKTVSGEEASIESELGKEDQMETKAGNEDQIETESGKEDTIEIESGEEILADDTTDTPEHVDKESKHDTSNDIEIISGSKDENEVDTNDKLKMEATSVKPINDKEKVDEEIDNITKKYIDLVEPQDNSNNKGQNEADKQIGETEYIPDSDVADQEEEKENIENELTENCDAPSEDQKKNQNIELDTSDEIILSNDIQDCLEVLEEGENNDTTKQSSNEETQNKNEEKDSEDVGSSEDFGSLIDEMQKCLTSNNDESLNNQESEDKTSEEDMDTLELLASPSPTKECEEITDRNNDPKSPALDESRETE